MPIITGRTLKAPASGFFLFWAGCIIMGQNHEKGGAAVKLPTNPCKRCSHLYLTRDFLRFHLLFKSII